MRAPGRAPRASRLRARHLISPALPPMRPRVRKLSVASGRGRLARPALALVLIPDSSTTAGAVAFKKGRILIPQGAKYEPFEIPTSRNPTDIPQCPSGIPVALATPSRGRRPDRQRHVRPGLPPARLRVPPSRPGAERRRCPLRVATGKKWSTSPHFTRPIVVNALRRHHQQNARLTSASGASIVGPISNHSSCYSNIPSRLRTCCVALRAGSPGPIIQRDIAPPSCGDPSAPSGDVVCPIGTTDVRVSGRRRLGH